MVLLVEVVMFLSVSTKYFILSDQIDASESKKGNPKSPTAEMEDKWEQSDNDAITMTERISSSE